MNDPNVIEVLTNINETIRYGFLGIFVYLTVILILLCSK